jgi:hypothetical protein
VPKHGTKRTALIRKLEKENKTPDYIKSYLRGVDQVIERYANRGEKKDGRSVLRTHEAPNHGRNRKR